MSQNTLSTYKMENVCEFMSLWFVFSLQLCTWLSALITILRCCLDTKGDFIRKVDGYSLWRFCLVSYEERATYYKLRYLLATNLPMISSSRIFTTVAISPFVCINDSCPNCPFFSDFFAVIVFRITSSLIGLL